MFGLLGKIIAAPIKLINVPLTVVDKVLDSTVPGPSTRVLSAPLNAVAETIEEEMEELDE